MISKNLHFAAAFAMLLIGVLGYFAFRPVSFDRAIPDGLSKVERPSDWFHKQRAFPYSAIPHEKLYRAVAQTQSMKQKVSLSGGSPSWQFAGPTNVGGRITDVEMSPGSHDTLYAGAASGGVFKSIDRGQTWQPVFDDAPSLSIGDIALDPQHPNTVYVGTGEVNGGGGSVTYGGFGVFKSVDAGESWAHLGLQDTRFVARIAVDPRDSQRVFAATMGTLFSRNPDRGLYRSADGGGTWENVLFLSDSTGCIDVVVHPTSPDTVYAAMWERIREPHRRSYGGVTSGLYRSTDGGDSWSELSSGLPNNSRLVGRIGLAISPSHPNVLYAIYADNVGPLLGVYKTVDGGDSWQRIDKPSMAGVFASFGWWFGNIRVSPVDPEVVYAVGFDVYKTSNGGQTWSNTSLGVHVDHHGLAISVSDPDFVVDGNDGGIYLSNNAGDNWSKVRNLPITQFYTCEIDEQLPQRLYGGTQDNGTNRTQTGRLDDWQHIFGGDGFYVLVDPTDNRFVYAEFQFGNLARSTNGGASFQRARNGISSGERSNWNAPVVFNPQNPKSLYFGTERIYKSSNRAQSWQPISPGLSNGPGENQVFGTVSTIAVAASDTFFVYAGTDDGNVWATQNGGQSWRKLSGDLPTRWVTRLAVDPADERTVFVTLSGFRLDSYMPHIFMSEDAGEAWLDISGNLPDAPINDVIVDEQMPGTLYIASDVGVFVTHDLGQDWQPVIDGLPNVPVNDIDFHASTRTLVAATYGRSMYRLDVGSATDVRSRPSGAQPADFVLSQNYPNPFNAGTTIRYELSRPSEVQLEVFDIRGRLVQTLARGRRDAGVHNLQWSGVDALGRPVASGTYIYRLSTDEQILVHRMTLVK